MWIYVLWYAYLWNHLTNVHRIRRSVSFTDIQGHIRSFWERSPVGTDTDTMLLHSQWNISGHSSVKSTTGWEYHRWSHVVGSYITFYITPSQWFLTDVGHTKYDIMACLIFLSLLWPWMVRLVPVLAHNQLFPHLHIGCHCFQVVLAGKLWQARFPAPRVWGRTHHPWLREVPKYDYEIWEHG